MKPALHPQEEDRLRELRRYGILDTERERDFDELVELASALCEAPVSVVNFIDEGRQWFKAEVGLGVRSTPIETSLCGHVILQGDFVEIPDTLKDERMADNPLCTDNPGFRFYAGAVLKGENGLPLGTFCILDHKPRTLTDQQRSVIRVLGQHVMRALNLRLAFEREQTLRREVDHRVKNSLASISSIITMKARRSPDEGTRTALEDIGLRIRSLASLHEQLQDVGADQTVDLVVLFERVGTDLRQLLPQGVDLDIRVTGRQVAPALANSLLLIVNEFVSNSVKHGLSKKGGNISIAIDAGTAGDNWSIVCKDTGDASAQDAQRAAQSSGLGTRVIHSIARGLDAQVEFSADGGGMKLAVRK